MMQLKILTSVCRRDSRGRVFGYPGGVIVEVTDELIIRDLLKYGRAEQNYDNLNESLPRAVAESPEIKKGQVIHAVVKRGRKPKGYINTPSE